MTAPIRLLLAFVVMAACGCAVDNTEPVGQPCTSSSECTQSGYACLPDPALDGGSTCQLVFPRPVPTDGGTPDAGPPPTVFYCGAVQNALTTYCANCHGVDRSQASNLPFRLDVYEDLDGGSVAGGIDGAKTKADRVKVRLTDPLYPPMPPVGQPQPDAMTKQLIVNWVDSGAQQCDGGM